MHLILQDLSIWADFSQNGSLRITALLIWWLSSRCQMEETLIIKWFIQNQPAEHHGHHILLNKAVPESSRPPSAHRTGPTHADNAGESHFRLQQTSLVKEHLEGHRHCPGRERGRGLCLIATMCLTKHRFFRVSPWVHLILLSLIHI